MSVRSGESQIEIRSALFARADLLFLAFVIVFIYCQLFQFPFTPIYFEGDHMLPVSNAMRLLDGEVMYRDFFHFTPPGTELWYAALFSIFGTQIWVLNATILVLGIAQLILILYISKQFLAGTHAYLPAIIYFVVGLRQFGLDGSNRLFSVVFVLAAAAFLFKKRSASVLAIVGGLCGFAAFFVHARGFLGIVAFALFLLWEEWRGGLNFKRLIKSWLLIGMPFLAVVAVTQFYFAMLAGFDNYYFANVTFLKDHYGSDTLSNTFAYLSDLPDLQAYMGNYGNFGGVFRYVRVAFPTLFYYLLIPLVYLLFLIGRRWRSSGNGTQKAESGLMLLCILGLVFFLGASAPTGLRLYQIAIPGIVIFVWLLGRISKIQRAMTPAFMILCLLGSAFSVQRQLIHKTYADLPAGRAAFLSDGAAEKYRWLAAETKPGEYLFEAQHPSFYFPLHLKNPTPYYLVRDNNYTPSFQVETLMKALESRPPRFIIWHGLWSKEPSERKPGDNLAPLWDFIRTNYELRHEFREFGEFTTNSERDIEIWEKQN